MKVTDNSPLLFINGNLVDAYDNYKYNSKNARTNIDRVIRSNKIEGSLERVNVIWENLNPVLMDKSDYYSI